MSKTTGKNGADESVIENVQPAAELTDDKKPQEAKTPEERLAELFAKAKKNGKISAKEIAALDEAGIDPEAMGKFYESLEAGGIEVDIGGDDLLPCYPGGSLDYPDSVYEEVRQIWLSGKNAE